MKPLTMGLWREIEKLEIDITESRKNLATSVEKLTQVNNDIFFDVLSKKFEIAIAENNKMISERKNEIVLKVFDKVEDTETQYKIIKNAILILLDKKAKEMPETKGSKTNYDNMNGYQQVIHLYSILHREYRWTRQTIDNEEIEYIYDLTIVQALGHEEKEAPIDAVL